MTGVSMQRPETPSWVAGGVGHVRERTIEVGDSIVAVENIATMHVVASQRNWGPAVAGSLLILIGLFLLFWPKTMLPYTFILVIGGIGCVVWVFARPPLHYLAIGTSDGRRTHIVSKSLEFLISVRDLFREKIDTQNTNLQGQINITLARFEPRGATPPPPGSATPKR